MIRRDSNWNVSRNAYEGAKRNCFGFRRCDLRDLGVRRLFLRCGSSLDAQSSFRHGSVTSAILYGHPGAAVRWDCYSHLG